MGLKPASDLTGDSAGQSPRVTTQTTATGERVMFNDDSGTARDWGAQKLHRRKHSRIGASRALEKPGFSIFPWGRRPPRSLSTDSQNPRGAGALRVLSWKGPTGPGPRVPGLHCCLVLQRQPWRIGVASGRRGCLCSSSCSRAQVRLAERGQPCCCPGAVSGVELQLPAPAASRLTQRQGPE